jgi:putative transcriptional regulator
MRDDKDCDIQFLHATALQHMERIPMLARLIAALLVLLSAGAARAQSLEAAEEDAVFLVAHPGFLQKSYYHTVLIAAPIKGGGHIGVILNRPTNFSLTSLFPEHVPSKQVAEPVRYGGPFSTGALVAVVKGDKNPGTGALPLMKNLYIAFRAATIDKVIEETPNDARYFMGYVAWRPNELKSEIDKGLWSVVQASPDTIFQKDLSGLWEELLAQTRRLQAGTAGEFSPYPPIASFGAAR